MPQSTTDTASVADLAAMFEYLDELRESGKTNMFGAGPYLARRFKLKEGASREVLSQWRTTFERDVSPEHRSAKALGK